MAPIKQPTTSNRTTSKGKFISTAGGIISKQPQPQPYRGRDYLCVLLESSWRRPPTINVQGPTPPNVH